MKKKEETKAQSTSEFNRDKDWAIAAGIGAVTGGAAFATAAYSAGILESEQEEIIDDGKMTEHNEVTVEIHRPEVIPVETLSSSTGDVLTEPYIAEPYITEPSVLPDNDEVNIVTVESNGMHLENIGYPTEGAILHSDMQEVMDVSINQTVDTSSVDSINETVDSINEAYDDNVTDDYLLYLI